MYLYIFRIYILKEIIHEYYLYILILHFWKFLLMFLQFFFFNFY